MKLIDLLVLELPKIGGWPEGVDNITQYSCGELCFNDDSGVCIVACPGITLEPHDDGDKGRNTLERWAYGIKVTRDQYESALAASQKVEWDGAGLPPVGCECEARYREVDGAEWFFFRCVGVDCGVAFGWAGKDAVTLGKGSYQFRPLHSKADKKRDATLDAIYGAIVSAEREHNRSDEADKVYEAIAAGKIPGVKLDD